MNIIVGTAGHIDHGKTALVKALTGVDADRLPEEKKRGITIDLGFAELDLEDVKIGFIDVPGHEKFVKNMLAGAGGIDLVLLVVAADEGVMPQTREHFEICRLLKTKKGLIVLTKADLADEELLEIVKLDIAELVENSFLEDAPMLEVSAKTGAGIDELKNALKKSALQIPERKNETIARLPVDRVFTSKGFGTIVTGTLNSGEIIEADEMEILPLQKKVRIRGLQTHGQTIKKVYAGQRAAANLGGIEHSEIERGMILAESGVLRPVQILDAELEVLKIAEKSLKSRRRVRVHLGTLEALARLQILNETGEIEPGAKGFAQLRLEIPVAAVLGERFILRSYSPQMTIAGGKILDNAAAKHRPRDAAEAGKYLQHLLEAETDKPKTIKLYLETTGERGANLADLRARTGWRTEILRNAIRENLEKKAVVEAENVWLARTPFDDLKSKTLAEIGKYHKKEPLAKGISRETLREKLFAYLPPEIFRAILNALTKEHKIAAEKDFVRLVSHNLELSAEEGQVRENLSKIYQNSALEVPKLEDALLETVQNTKLTGEHARKIFRLLVNAGELVKISEEFYFAAKEINLLTEKLREFAAKTTDRIIDVSTFKDLANISRKYAIPLLEYFDREKITARKADKRIIL